MSAEDQAAEFLASARRRAEAVAMPFSPHRCCEMSQADVPHLLAAIEAVLELHREFKIYEECGHEHTDDEVRAGVAVDATEFLSCTDGYAYSVCRACCTGGWSQTEECASDHDVAKCWPCPTREAVSSPLREAAGGSR